MRRSGKAENLLRVVQVGRGSAISSLPGFIGRIHCAILPVTSASKRQQLAHNQRILPVDRQIPTNSPGLGTRQTYMAQLAAIVLAAGTSRRMGTQKLLLSLGGSPLVQIVVEAANASVVDLVVVVLGHDAGNVRRALPVGRQRDIFNPDFETGMASSLRAGIRALPSETAGAIVLLGDQPLIDSATIDVVCKTATACPQGIVVPTYQGRRGHPVYFPARLFQEIAGIVGDEGARSIIRRHPDSVRELELGETRDLDADTPPAYAALASEWDLRHHPAD